MSITVTYDTQIFRLQRQGGISRYFSELIGAYRRDPELGIDPRLPGRVVAARHLKEAQLGPRLVVPRALTRAWNLLPAGSRRRRAADLVHHTYYLPRELHADWAVPRVTTIHDMIPELFPGHFPRGNPHQAKRSYVEQSHGLLFVSETSKRDLLRLYGPQDVPMAVAPLAPGAAFFPRREPTVVNPYVVFVGNRGGYKEFDTLLAALAQTPGLSLWAVGGGALGAAEQVRVRELGLESRVTQISVRDDQLAALYSCAVALVVPSRYEGFGLPVVEAMACGCPVVVSDIDVFHEVADEAAEYFPAGDASALAAALERISADEALRRSRRQSGLVRVRDFTWERTAEVTAGLYEQVLDRGRSGAPFIRSA